MVISENNWYQYIGEKIEVKTSFGLKHTFLKGQFYEISRIDRQNIFVNVDNGRGGYLADYVAFRWYSFLTSFKEPSV